MKKQMQFILRKTQAKNRQFR